MGKAELLFLRGFLLALTKFSFWEKDWALGYNFTTFWCFPNIPYVVQQLVNQLVYTMFITNNHALFHLRQKSQNIMTIIVEIELK